MKRTALVSLSLAACGTPPPTTPPLVVVSTVPSVAAPAPSASVATAPPPHAKIPVRLDFEPTTFEPGGRALWLVVNDEKVNEPVFLLHPAQRCVAETRASGVRRGNGAASIDDAASMSVACGAALFAEISIRGEKVFVARSEQSSKGEIVGHLPLAVALPASAEVVFDATINDAPAACPPGSASPPLAVRVAREGGLGDPVAPSEKQRYLWIRASSLAVADWLGQKAYCHAHRYQSEKRWSLACALGESSFVVAANVEADALYFRRITNDMGRPPHEEPLGGVALCGATVKFPSVHLLDRGWAGQAFRGASCHMTFDLCTDPCWATMSDEAGELTVAGQSCESACGVTRDACIRRVFARP
jgi:hypothetical protein